MRLHGGVPKSLIPALNPRVCVAVETAAVQFVFPERAVAYLGRSLAAK